MKWNETNWNEMKWNEMKRNEMKWNEMKWNEMKWNEMKWNEMKWNENENEWYFQVCYTLSLNYFKIAFWESLIKANPSTIIS